jgi:hypothetical protein
MESTEADKLRYPIGRYMRPEAITSEMLSGWTADIERLPGELRSLVSGLSGEQLSLRYRPGGWTIRQVVHHLPDSHMNSFMRFKLALTEKSPIIKPYLEDKWAELPDGEGADVSISLNLLEALHKRWAYLLRNMTPGQFQLVYIHPERKSPQRLDGVLGLYAWHGKHHLAHVRQALEKKF